MFTLLAITILLIGVVRLVIIRDTNQTTQRHLHNVTERYSTSVNLTLFSFNRASDIVFEQLQTKSFYNNFLDKKNGSLNEGISSESFDDELVDYFEFLDKNGISINIIVPSEFSSIRKSELVPNITITNSNEVSYQFENQEQKLLTRGFIYRDNCIGYQFRYQIYNGENQAIVEITHDIHHVKNELYNGIVNNKVSYLFATDNKELLNDNSKKDLIRLKNTNLFHDHEDVFPDELINDSDLWDDFLLKINNTLRNDSLAGFSLLNQDKDTSNIFSVIPLSTINSESKFFLIVNTSNDLVKYVTRMNNAILVINSIIILLAMFGITFLVFNRLTLIHNANQMKRSEAHLKELNDSKDKFFSIIAHDLKNPFNGIMGLSGYLSLEYDNVDDNERKEIIHDINIASKNAFNLLQNLLEWTRTQSGTIKNNPTTIIPDQVIDLSLETVSTLAKHKEIKFIRNILTQSYGFADENLVTTVIRNLSTNAIKFSPRNSIVEIIVREYHDELVFCIKDKGVGLTPDEIDKLFRIDVNFHKKGTEKETGTGLGLKICKEFIEYCNGRLWVISEKGEGSDFYFTLPKLNT